jgi:hypothetical protein
MIAFFKKLLKRKGPMTYDESIKAILAKQKAGHKTVDVEFGTELLKSMLQESSQLMGFVLHNTPKAENYLRFQFADDDNPQYSFNVIIQKNGKKLPPA